MSIKGFIKTSLLDHPQLITSVVFLGGCSWRCPHCHNRHLAWTPEMYSDYPIEEIEKSILKRRDWVDSITISGGEPTESPDILFELIQMARSLKLRVKVDTNGSQPDIIMPLIFKLQRGDMIAMDIKAPLDNPDLYAELTGGKANIEDVKRSVSYLMEEVESGSDKMWMPWFRTVRHPRLTDDDIQKILDAVGPQRHTTLEYYDIYSVDKREGK